MIDVRALDGLIHANGLSQRKVAEQIGMKEQKFYRCMKKRTFASRDIEKIIILLDIKDPMPIFFSNVVT